MTYELETEARNADPSERRQIEAELEANGRTERPHQHRAALLRAAPALCPFLPTLFAQMKAMLYFTTNAAMKEATMSRSSGSYTTSELSRRSGDIIAEALRHPVTITQRNKPRLVLLNIEDYERLMRQSDSRSAGTIETMSDGLFAEFENAVEAYAQEDEAGKP